MKVRYLKILIAHKSFTKFKTYNESLIRDYKLNCKYFGTVKRRLYGHDKEEDVV